MSKKAKKLVGSVFGVLGEQKYRPPPAQEVKPLPESMQGSAAALRRKRSRAGNRASTIMGESETLG